jgi:hypothetical protein
MISPASFDLGRAKTGQSSAELVFTIGSDKPGPVRLKFDLPAGVTAPEVELLEITPDAPVTKTLRFDIAENAAPGAKQIVITAKNASATGRLEVLEPSLVARMAKVLVALALLIAAGLFLFVRHRKQNELEGELEIVQPRVAPDIAFVGLPMLKKNEIALSSIVPIDALGGTDARLFVRHRKGAKQVCISADGGPLRVNDVETPMSELYDADLIEIGGAKLRFNRAGHGRAATSMEEL